MKLKLFRLLLITTACVVIFFATKYAFANLSYLKVDSYLTRWQDSNVVEETELIDALDSVDTMLYLHGHFPHYLNVAAKVYQWKAFKISSENTNENFNKESFAFQEYQDSLYQALHYYEQSTKLRFQWPMTWAFMANVKANLNQFDDQFYYYIEQAIKFGPYTNEVNLQIAKLQLRYWGELKELPVKVGLEHIKRALLNNKSRNVLLKYAVSVNREGIVCTVARLNDVEAATKHQICKSQTK